MKPWFDKLKMLQDETGLSLVESVVAVAIIGTAVVALVAALSTGSIAVNSLEEQVVAQRLATSQLESIKGSPYNTTYPVIDTPTGYAISVGISSIPDADPDIQKITVAISHEGADVLSIENYKANR